MCVPPYTPFSIHLQQHLTSKTYKMIEGGKENQTAATHTKDRDTNRQVESR